MYSHVFFDLDGTLLDSAQSILNALACAMRECGAGLRQPLDTTLVGPPLAEVVQRVEASGNQEMQARVIESFKKHYDERFYAEGTLFSGAVDLLQALQGLRLYIVTNKRLLPTQRIVERYKLTQYFQEVYCPDSFTPTKTSKKAVLASIIDQLRLNVHTCLYVGDTDGDRVAATDNSMACLLVKHGYHDTAVGAVPFYDFDEIKSLLTN